MGGVMGVGRLRQHCVRVSSVWAARRLQEYVCACRCVAMAAVAAGQCCAWPPRSPTSSNPGLLPRSPTSSTPQPPAPLTRASLMHRGAGGGRRVWAPPPPPSPGPHTSPAAGPGVVGWGGRGVGVGWEGGVCGVGWEGLGLGRGGIQGGQEGCRPASRPTAAASCAARQRAAGRSRGSREQQAERDKGSSRLEQQGLQQAGAAGAACPPGR